MGHLNFGDVTVVHEYWNGCEGDYSGEDNGWEEHSENGSVTDYLNSVLELDGESSCHGPNSVTSPIQILFREHHECGAWHNRM